MSMTDYANWGCEFDFEPYNPKPESYLQNSLWLPIELLELALNSESVSKLNPDKIKKYQTEISEDGLINPGFLIVGPNGSFLKDGNHRFQACKKIGYERFPVTLKPQEERIKVRGLPNQKLIEELAKALSIRRYK